jgi:DNA-binding NtrC family response regulator
MVSWSVSTSLANDGFINVYSEPGQGSSVKIYLPITHEATARQEEAAKTEIPTGSETILVVEDESSILELIEDTLQQLGYTVFTAKRPSEAIVLAQKHKASIDLLVTDVVMPEMNGKDLKLRIEAFIPHIKVLFMSGYTTNVIMHQGILERDIHFLQKPFPVDSLAEKVREVLDEPSERTGT